MAIANIKNNTIRRVIIVATLPVFLPLVIMLGAKDYIVEYIKELVIVWRNPIAY